MQNLVRTVLERHGRLLVRIDRLSETDDLHAAGLDSMAMVNVMLALEEALELEFPDAVMKRETFASIAALSAVLRRLSPAFATAA